MPIKMHWLRLFFVVFREIHISLTMPMFVGSQSSIPSLMFVGAAVSEICESNRNKTNLQNGYFHFNTIPGHIIDPIFSPELPLDHIYTLKLLEVQTESDNWSTHIMLANQGHPYILPY